MDTTALRAYVIRKFIKIAAVRLAHAVGSAGGLGCAGCIAAPHASGRDRSVGRAQACAELHNYASAAALVYGLSHPSLTTGKYQASWQVRTSQYNSTCTAAMGSGFESDIPPPRALSPRPPPRDLLPAPLDRMLQQVPAKQIQEFETLTALLQPKDDFAAYKRVLSAARPPLVPILGTHIHHRTQGTGLSAC